MIDLGCGMGYYIAELAKYGYDAHGVEGTPDIQGIALHKPIHQADLSEPLTVPLPDGHVLSFEVAEHLAIEDESTFIDNIILHARSRLLLSWALPDACAPGRGHGHLNCRSNLYVIRALFLRGYTLHENDTAWLRDQVRGSAAYWFEGTLLVFDSLALASLALHHLATGAESPVREGSRGRIQVAGKAGNSENSASRATCAGQLSVQEPAPGAAFLIEPGDGVDVSVDVLLHGCTETERDMVCVLVFLNDRCVDVRWC